MKFEQKTAFIIYFSIIALVMIVPGGRAGLFDRDLEFLQVRAPTIDSGPIRSVAVVVTNLANRNQGMAASLELSLSERLVDSDFFKLFDRANLDKITQEQGFSGSQLADPSTAVRIGQIAGVEGLIVGSINSIDSNSETRKYKSSDGGTVYKTYINFTVNAGFKLINVETGKVLAVETETAKTQFEEGTKTDDEACTICINRIKSSFACKIAPYYIRQEVHFITKDDLKKYKKCTRDKLKEAYNYMKNDLAEMAVDACRELTKEYPGCPSAHHNLGVALFVSGKYDEGLSEVKTAIKLNPKDKIPPKTLKNLRIWKEHIDTLNAMKREKGIEV